jgi:sialate O-acetylesterase
VVSSAAVSEPKAVRFAWHEAAQPNLFNRAGLPAVPFRTDKPRPSARQFATNNLASSK